MKKPRAKAIKAGQEWDEHWERYQASASLNPAQAYRRHLVLGAVAEGPALRIADLGCGQGDLLQELRVAFPNALLLGVDASQGGLAFAKAKVPGLKTWQANLEKGSPAPKALQGWADVITCTEVLEHLDHPERSLRTAFSLLKPGGRLILTVPGGPRSAYDLHIGHRQHYKTAALEALLESQGFHQARAWGAGFPFFNLYRLTVIARGQRLIEQAAQEDLGSAAKAALRVFGGLFKLNIDRGPLGWQVFSIASKP